LHHRAVIKERNVHEFHPIFEVHRWLCEEVVSMNVTKSPFHAFIAQDAAVFSHEMAFIIV
jgi:hypothetical protein